MDDYSFTEHNELIDMFGFPIMLRNTIECDPFGSDGKTIEIFSRSQKVVGDKIISTEYQDGIRTYEYVYDRPIWVPHDYSEAMMELRNRELDTSNPDNYRTVLRTAEELYLKYKDQFKLAHGSQLVSFAPGQNFDIKKPPFLNHALVMPMRIIDVCGVYYGEIQVEHHFPIGINRYMWRDDDWGLRTFPFKHDKTECVWAFDVL